MLAAEYCQLAGANAALQGAAANQMSAMGMSAQMYGANAQAQSQMFGSIAGAAGAGIGGYLAGGGTLAGMGAGFAALGPIAPIAIGLGIVSSFF